MQDCIKKVETKAVMTVKTKFAILLIVSRFIKLKFLKVIHYYILGDTPKPQFSYFLRREERSKEASTLPKAPPYMEGMQPLLLSLF